MPVNFEIGMEAALHENARPAKLNRLADFVVNGLEFEDVSLFGFRALQRTIEGAKSAVLGAVVRVINIAIDDVGDHALGMQLAAHGVGFHADADQIVRAEEIEGLLFAERHNRSEIILKEAGRRLQIEAYKGSGSATPCCARCVSTGVAPIA